MQFKHLSLLGLTTLISAQNTTQDLATLLTSTPDLSTLTSLVTSNPDLLAALTGASDITIIAPTNAAFEKLLSSPAGEGVTDDAGLVAAILQYHVLNGTFKAADISKTPAFVPTLLSNTSYTNVTGGQVVEAVVMGENVVFYTGLLMNSTVSTADISFTGGVIHIIDTVLTLPAPVTETAQAANLTSLFDAVNATGLVSVVNETPDITIFAPTNEAFAAIASALANATTEDIASVLAYHVINGTVGYSSGLKDGQELETVNGAKLTISVREGGVFVNGAKVVKADVLVANGVVHVIDNVLNPAETATPSPSATEGTPAFTASPTGSASPSASQFTGAAAPMKTGAVGAAALFGAGAAAVFVGY